MSIPSSDGRWKKGLLPTLRELGITTALLSLARMLHQGEDIIPIPGTSRRDRIAENAIAAKIIFDPEALEKISELAAPGSQ